MSSIRVPVPHNAPQHPTHANAAVASRPLWSCHRQLARAVHRRLRTVPHDLL